MTSKRSIRFQKNNEVFTFTAIALPFSIEIILELIGPNAPILLVLVLIPVGSVIGLNC